MHFCADQGEGGGGLTRGEGGGGGLTTVKGFFIVTVMQLGLHKVPF